jgi:dihydrolipoamide dehydrogenase
VAHRLGGEIHIYADKSNGKIYGAEMFAPGAEHFAHMLTRGIEAGATLNETLRMPFYHPSLEEGVRTALRDAAKQTSVTPPAVDLMRCSDAPVG